MLRFASRLRLQKAVATVTRSYVVPMQDLNFIIKDVYKFPEHYAKLGFDPEVNS
jgi:hypothetical protein